MRTQVYVWQLPIRIWHWLNVICITCLFITGLYIGNPAFSVSGEAYSTFVMGYVRIIHNLAAWIFVAGFILRVYWWIAGNQYSRVNPFTAEYWARLKEVTLSYLFIKRKSTPHAGHSAMAQLSYLTFIGLGSVIMMITGFAMQAETLPMSIRAKLFGWAIPAFGSSFIVRSTHHMVAWAILAFVIVHLYMAFRQDILEQDGAVSSIITGYKYLPSEVVDHEKK